MMEENIDWRRGLFGPTLFANAGDDETAAIRTEDALSQEKFDYVAVFIGGQHCPYCRDFAPHVLRSAPALEREKRCKVVFMSADKTEENYGIMRNKLRGIPAVPYDLDRTQSTRDLFQLKTVPVLIILRNRNFSRAAPELVTNARHMLASDPTLDGLQWEEADWRRGLFGPKLFVNSNDDDETAAISTEEGLSEEKFKYVAVFIGGQHWDFAPHVLKSAPALERGKRCKVIFMSADKTEENYGIMRNKLQGIPAVPYDLDRTQSTRALFQLKTVPVLIILRNRNFSRAAPEFVTNARHMLVSDPTLDGLQWEEAQDKSAVDLSGICINSLHEAKKLEMALAKAKEERLRTMDVFVLDNSLRETAVAAVKGQVASDKDQILASVSKTGISDYIVAAFGELRRPEDVWLQEKRTNNQIQKSFWAFSEIADVRFEDGPPVPSNDDISMPYGILRCKDYGLSNIILEIDVAHWTNFQLKDFQRLFQTRMDAIREFSPDAKVLINLRDAPSAYFHENMPEKLKQIIQAAASVTPKLFGLAFEDPTAELLPWHLGILSAEMKQCMKEHGWDEGHLLIHVHKRFGLSDAAVLEALSMGATGLWCAVCEEGGGIGHSCSLTTLVNLARMGNENVTKKYNLRAMHEAAVRITNITTGLMPHPRVEVYGAQAMDVVFPEGGMGSGGTDLSELLGTEKNIRVSPFTDEGMMRQKLNSVFGEYEWEKFVLDFMIILIHLDLEHGYSWEYNGPAGLLDLYVRAGGTENTKVMNKVLVERYCAEEKDTPLLRDLRRKFDSCHQIELATQTPLNSYALRRKSERPRVENKDEQTAAMTTMIAASKFRRGLIKKLLKTSDKLSYEEFYQGFLGPYHAHANIDPLETKVVMDTLRFLDSDGSGCIEWGELSSRVLWVLENVKPEDRARWTLRDILDNLFNNAKMNGSATHAIFLRENDRMIKDLCERISNDSRIEPLRKTQNYHVLKTFVTSLLMVGCMDFDNEKAHSLAIKMLMNIASVIFSEDDAEAAFELVVEHVTECGGAKSSSFKFNKRLSSLCVRASFNMSELDDALLEESFRLSDSEH